MAEPESFAKENKRLAHRLYEEALSQGSYAAMDEIADENLVDHGAPLGAAGGRRPEPQTSGLKM